MKICIYATFFFLLCNVGVEAQTISSNNVVLSHDPIVGDGDIQIDFAGHLLILNEPGLEVETFTIGVDFFMFRANEGDVLTGNIAESVEYIPIMMGSPLDIPLGDSYLGFALGEPVDGAPWYAIGWAELSRDADGLEVLGSATSFGTPAAIGFQPGASPGITVGVPEPSSAPALLWLLGLSFAFCRRKR